MELIITTKEDLEKTLETSLQKFFPQLNEKEQKRIPSGNQIETATMPMGGYNESRYVYSNKDAAKRLGVSTVTFQYWKNKKLFEFTQIGRSCIYDIPLIMQQLGELSKPNSKRKSR